jgi:8-oxo-dGTP pyrophosphatase MutT (NUDIX family)
MFRKNRTGIRFFNHGLFNHPIALDCARPKCLACAAALANEPDWAADFMATFIARARNRAFHMLFLATRAMTLGARVAFFNEKGEVCLIKHGYVPGWQLPGGGVDLGETIEAAAKRELVEEAGYAATGPLTLFALYKNERASRRDHVALYVCRAAKAIDGFAVDGREITHCGFFSPDAMPDDTSPSTRRRIDELMGRQPIDAYW